MRKSLFAADAVLEEGKPYRLHLHSASDTFVGHIIPHKQYVVNSIVGLFIESTYAPVIAYGRAMEPNTADVKQMFLCPGYDKKGREILLLVDGTLEDLEDHPDVTFIPSIRYIRHLCGLGNKLA